MNRYDFDFGLAPVRSDAVRRSVLATPPRTRFEPKTPSRAHYERVPIRKTHPVTKKESVPPPTVEYAPPKLRETIANALGSLGDKSTANVFLKILEDPKLPSIIRRISVRILGKLGNDKALPALLRCIQNETFEVQTRMLAVGSYSSISTSIDPQLRELADLIRYRQSNAGDARKIRGRIVQAVSRKAAAEEEFVWLENVARHDWDFINRTEAVRALFRLGRAKENLVRFLIDPRYQRKDGRKWETDGGVKGAVAAGIMTAFSNGESPTDTMLELVVGLFNDPETWSDVIHAGLSPLRQTDPEDAQRALDRISGLTENKTLNNKWFRKVLDYHREKLESRLRITREIEAIKNRPEDILMHFKKRSESGFSVTDKEKEWEMKPLDAAIITAVEVESRAFFNILRERGISYKTIPVNRRLYYRFELTDALFNRVQFLLSPVFPSQFYQLSP